MQCSVAVSSVFSYARSELLVIEFIKAKGFAVESQFRAEVV